MFCNIGSMRYVVERLEEAQDEQAFQAAISILMDHMKKIGMDSKYLLNVEKHWFYYE